MSEETTDLVGVTVPWNLVIIGFVLFVVILTAIAENRGELQAYRRMAAGGRLSSVLTPTERERLIHSINEAVRRETIKP